MRASLRESRNIPDVMSLFAMFSINSVIDSMMSLRSSVGYTFHDLDGDSNRNLITSFSLIGANSSKHQSKSMLGFSVDGVCPEVSVVLLMSCSLVLIFSILLVKNLLN